MKYTIILLVTHFVADFLLQPREMAVNKSVKPKWLFAHAAIIFAAVGLVLSPHFGYRGLLFAAINALVHGAIDWNIWRGYKYSILTRLDIKHMDQNAPQVQALKDDWKFYEDSWFFHTIGIDQLLHTLTLVILAGYL